MNTSDHYDRHLLKSRRIAINSPIKSSKVKKIKVNKKIESLTIKKKKKDYDWGRRNVSSKYYEM